MSTTAKPATAAITAAAQKCTYCAGTGRWSKDVIYGKPPESVYCPHCHGSGLGGAADSGGAGSGE